MRLVKQVQNKGEDRIEDICHMDYVKEIILKEGNGRCDKIIFEMPEVSLENVNSSYNGGLGCMCGCTGTYAYLESSREKAGKERGYEIQEDEINPKSVNFVINKLKKEASRGIGVIGDYIYFLEIGKKNYTLYLQRS